MCKERGASFCSQTLRDGKVVKGWSPSSCLPAPNVIWQSPKSEVSIIY